MITFKSFYQDLQESQKKIDYHLGKSSPEHAAFINSYLGNDKKTRHIRSKYLDWVTNGLKDQTQKQGDPLPPDPVTLGRSIDYYHSAKESPNFTEHRDINKMGTHKSFVDKMDNLKYGAPISKEESNYNHPDNTVIHNSHGLKITQIGSHRAMAQSRNHFVNSWCVAQPGKEGERFFKQYKNLHLYENRDTETGKISRQLYGIYKENGQASFMDLKDNPIQPSNDLKDKLYRFGHEGVKGNFTYASDEQKKKMVKENPENLSKENIQDMITASNPEMSKYMLQHASHVLSTKHLSVISNRHPDLSADILKKATSEHLQDNLLAHNLIYHDKTLAKGIFEKTGSDTYPEVQSRLARDFPNMHEELIKTMGKKLDSSAARSISQNKELHPQLVNSGAKLTATTNNKIYNESPELRDKLVQNGTSGIEHHVLENHPEAYDRLAQNLVSKDMYDKEIKGGIHSIYSHPDMKEKIWKHMLTNPEKIQNNELLNHIMGHHQDDHDRFFKMGEKMPEIVQNHLIYNDPIRHTDNFLKHIGKAMSPDVLSRMVHANSRRTAQGSGSIIKHILDHHPDKIDKTVESAITYSSMEHPDNKDSIANMKQLLSMKPLSSSLSYERLSHHPALRKDLITNFKRNKELSAYERKDVKYHLFTSSRIAQNIGHKFKNKIDGLRYNDGIIGRSINRFKEWQYNRQNPQG